MLRYVPAWFPGAGFQKDFARWREASLALKNMPFDHVKDEVVGQADLGDIPRPEGCDIIDRVVSIVQGP